MDCLTNFGSDLAMCAVGVGLASDAFSTEFFFGLRRSKQVRGQLGAAHVVKDLFARLKLLPSVNVLGRQSAIQPLIAVILEDGVILRLDDTAPRAASASWMLCVRSSSRSLKRRSASLASSLSSCRRV